MQNKEYQKSKILLMYNNLCVACANTDTYHQSQVKSAWLNIVPLGHKNDILRSAMPGANCEAKQTW